MGNTCYLNAGLQMLIQNIDLCNLILKYSEYSLILNKLSILISEYYNKNSNPISPIQIKKIIEDKSPMFNGWGQQDSTEFVISLLDIIDTEIKKIDKNSKGIYNIFGINLNVRIKCKHTECLQIFNHTEENNFLLLDLDSNISTLDDLYRKFKSSDILDNDNQYYCEKCGKKRDATKRYEIIDWPNYLFIQFKRFKQNGNNYTKQNQQIDINLKWRHDMELVGAIIHYGNINSGHYVYVGKQLDKWYLYNDASVSEIMNDIELNKILYHAYWLMYKKNKFN